MKLNNKWDHQKLIDVRDMLEQPVNPGVARSLFSSRQVSNLRSAKKEVNSTYVASNPYAHKQYPETAKKEQKKEPDQIEQLSVEKQTYLKALLDLQSNRDRKISPNIQFRYHKNLATPQYEEYLAESDDEEFFNSQPLTYKGENYELDFKIDAYRDQISINRFGNQKRLVRAEPKLQAATELDTSTTVDNLPQGSAIDRYRMAEDLSQIPFISKGDFNKTVLRCAEASFKIDDSGRENQNQLGYITKRQSNLVSRAIAQRNMQPIFSGNVQSYLINQLADHEIITKVRNITSKAHLCALYPYYQRMWAQSNTQFAEVAQKIFIEI